ncbi:hypothetical protein Tco_0409592, partial [Tanacetum coccineum]
MLVNRIPELMHVDFWNICSDEICRLAWSESQSIRNNLKCGLSLDLSRIESFVAFSNVKYFLLWNKFQIKFGLLSRYELPPSLVRFLCQTFQRLWSHASCWEKQVNWSIGQRTAKQNVKVLLSRKS